MENDRIKRIVVIANKSWEADPMVNAILHEKIRPKSFDDFDTSGQPLLIDKKDPNNPNPPIHPRIEFTCSISNKSARIEIWCLQDLMNPNVSSSSTTEKWRVLPRIINYRRGIDFLIAFGTAGITDLGICNGSVVIGSRVFIHNPYINVTGDDTKHDTWTNPNLDKLIVLQKELEVDFRSMADDVRYKAETKFVNSPLEPAKPPIILAGHGFYSMGVVNVTDYDDYIWADKSAIATFRKKGYKGVIGSIESTHGLIRLQTEVPFLFVSGITDEDGKFDSQVTPRVYAQNFVAAHNAGIALCYLLEDITGQFFK
jgi:hypothetical protein